MDGESSESAIVGSPPGPSLSEVEKMKLPIYRLRCDHVVTFSIFARYLSRGFFGNGPNRIAFRVYATKTAAMQGKTDLSCYGEGRNNSTNSLLRAIYANALFGDDLGNDVLFMLYGSRRSIQLEDSNTHTILHDVQCYLRYRVQKCSPKKRPTKRTAAPITKMERSYVVMNKDGTTEYVRKRLKTLHSFFPKNGMNTTASVPSPPPPSPSPALTPAH